MSRAVKQRLDTQRRVAALGTAVVTVACLMLLGLFLEGRHTAGGEIVGVIAAGGGVAISVLSLVHICLSRDHRLARVLLMVLWLVLAVGGIGGLIDHAEPVVPGQSIDQRPRPPLAPLVFTGLALLGATALGVGSRRQRRQDDETP